jgi:hypothetical protein
MGFAGREKTNVILPIVKLRPPTREAMKHVMFQTAAVTQGTTILMLLFIMVRAMTGVVSAEARVIARCCRAHRHAVELLPLGGVTLIANRY